MQDLIAKLEAATEGSRELDVAIVKMLHPEIVQWGDHCWSVGNKYFLPGHDKYSLERWNAAKSAMPFDADIRQADFYRHIHVPRFTVSLDAAMTLVPEGWEWLVRSDFGLRGRGYANVYSDESENVQRHPQYAATPALALCIAALKTREAAK